MHIDKDILIAHGMLANESDALIATINDLLAKVQNPENTWAELASVLTKYKCPFSIHLYLAQQLFKTWPDHLDQGPAWLPDAKTQTNLQTFMNEKHFTDVKAFHQYSVKDYETFWADVTARLNIRFQHPFTKVCDLSDGITSPSWFKDGYINIVNSCFNAPPETTAIVYEKAGVLQKMSYATLNQLSNSIANSLVTLGLGVGDAIAIIMPMNELAIAIYLGIVKMGGVVISIADSFSSDEINTRLKIANTKAIFTQDTLGWNEKVLPLYEKLLVIDAPLTIVIPRTDTLAHSLRACDYAWDKFLKNEIEFEAIPLKPMSACNILFSSGTTGTPKAIIWNHTTPIRAASDAFFHHDIKPGDVLAWPSNLGWMMGPWLIFAALINQATIAVYTGAPKDEAFGRFIEKAQVTMLGVVPTLVAHWRQTQCMQTCDWQKIKVFSSTGECSNPVDMLYLMSLAGYKPIIEYCGGTEIGGAYISSTLLQKNYPSLFSTPTMGTQFCLLDSDGKESDIGEVALIPPSLGWSTRLLNADHKTVYFANMPKSKQGAMLRRHGDFIQRLPNHYYTILGRVDDTMNLGGIKISAVEIERTLATIEGVSECAAVAIQPENNGPSLLVVYAVMQQKMEKANLLSIMQTHMNQHLNPLFKIHDIIFVDSLPKTASNKIMRRLLKEKVN